MTVHSVMMLRTYVYICISCNMGKRDLPDMYAQKPEGRRPEG